MGTLSMSEPNMRVLRLSRPKLRDGDVFVLSPGDGPFLFGRVIDADLPRTRAPMPESNLIYVYRYRSDKPAPDRSEMVPDALLIPPVYINRMPWTKGYFQNIDHWPLSDADLLDQHCFWSGVWEKYVDEKFNELPAKVDPCGHWALDSYRTFDDTVSEALEIPPAPA